VTHWAVGASVSQGRREVTVRFKYSAEITRVTEASDTDQKANFMAPCPIRASAEFSPVAIVQWRVIGWLAFKRI
jgi:hypothetical protein